MTSRSRTPFAGRLEAIGFIFDPAHLSDLEISQRIEAAWDPGSRLLVLDGKPLLLRRTPISVRAEHAPGLPVILVDDRPSLMLAGRPQVLEPEVLESLPLAQILDLTQFATADLDPSPTFAQTPPPFVPPPSRETTSIKVKAQIKKASSATDRQTARLTQDLSGQAGPSHTALSRLLARLAQRRPMTPVLRRRHQRYLNRLASSFEARDWDQALRSAIAINALTGSHSVRLPTKRRGELRPQRQTPTPGSGIPYGPTVNAHLHQLYETAARELERTRDHLRAAFVHADLLGNVTAAVDLLERHCLYREAAELAEVRSPDPAVAVRLWWRAGDRQRAIEVAKARGAYASAVARLQQVEPDQAHDLRRAWMHDRREAGDHLGAIAAAWPDEELRAQTLPHIAAAIAAGGRSSGTALAHWLALKTDPHAVDSAREILGSSSELAAARAGLITTLSTTQLSDPAVDRELTSLALLSIAAGSTPLSGDSFHDLVARLQKRADPLLVADLPRIRPAIPDASNPVHLDATTSGTMEVFDAAAVGHHSVLVALGEAGVQLLTLDGRTRARWDIPAHRLVLADHAMRVLVISDRDPQFHVHQIDLPTGRPHRLPSLGNLPLQTYDGARPVIVSPRGIEWVEPVDDRWRVVWRELHEPHQQVHIVSRSDQHLAALFTDNTDHSLNAWQWEMPTIALRQRGTIEYAEHLAMVATGEVGRLHQRAGVAVLDWHSPYGHRLTTETLHPDGEINVLTSGSAWALVDESTMHRRVTVHVRREDQPSATLDVPLAASLLFRSGPGSLTTGHRGGRVVVLNSDLGTVTADLTLTV